MILLIDNYDSFAHNLARYLRLLGQPVHVIRNDALNGPAIDSIGDRGTRAIVVSPGPCRPDDAGSTLEIILRWYEELPILGVCLGHQAIAQALGGSIVRADRPVHGQSTIVFHDGRADFSSIDSPFQAGRYHSLVVAPDSVPDELEVSAWTEERTIMALRHRRYPVFGWQFHPESILTPCGLDLLRNFLHQAKLPCDSTRSYNAEYAKESVDLAIWPDRPVTF